jgi:hypothetical protein
MRHIRVYLKNAWELLAGNFQAIILVQVHFVNMELPESASCDRPTLYYECLVQSWVQL